MSTAARMSEARLRTIYKRQDPPQFGPTYDPAIRATREEAPSSSRYSQMWSEKLQRQCHVLSTPEQKAMFLVLFQPGLFELQEQRMLAIQSRPHPLTGHPFASGLNLRPLRGTLDVCERIQMVERHAWISIRHPDNGAKASVPYPFIGDLLLFLQDQHGPYCVNWTIKRDRDGFERSVHRERPSRDPNADAAAARARHAIEQLYYDDANIPTVRVTEDMFPEKLLRNLECLYLTQHLSATVDSVLYQEMCERLRASMILGGAPFDVVRSMMTRYDLPFDIAKSLFHRAIWRRDVRPELVDEGIFIDIPLQPERTDPLVRFGHLFQRRTA
ncbi:hypothetical protein QWZ03_16010 [Chitinimonas viridis]|uniref:Transposase n=1 Tax=Chitinimonas viridis TaxID=664880 RepID=A0ABT8B7N7_9NEIS|nr:hypothetical protein [Chitinimonas viridis]MDN3578274.1 hypothetical protein [Chitinimonas viridis]